MSPGDIRRAYPAKNTYKIQIINQPYPVFDRNLYLSVVDIAAASNVTACNSAVESIPCLQDNSHSGARIYSTDSGPLMEEALIECYLFKN